MSQPEPTRAYRHYVLGLLVLVYAMNFLDRQILGILAPKIKADFHLSDGQLGLMGGLAFALLYSTLGVPIGWLADRASRRRIITVALGLWSGFTALCGLATGFWSLFLARVGVGVGEAGGVAPSYSLIADYFPRHQRARALAVFSLGIPLGTSCGWLFGGLIANAYGWRAAFISAGAAGLVLTPVFYFTVRDPRRGGSEATGQPAAPASFAEVFKLLANKPTFWLVAFGAAMSSVCGYGIAFWLPSFLIRSFHLSQVETSLFGSALVLVGGSLGILAGGVIADRAGARNVSAYPVIPAIAFLIAVPCFLFAMNAPSLWLAFVLFLIPTGLNLAWLGPVVTTVQHLVPAHQRSTASAMFLLINNLLGIAVGVYYFGAVSDLLRPRFGDESLRYAFYTGLGFYVIASALLFTAARTVRKDWVA
jgi:predicted MFS family arabinose efflux permease